MESVIQKINSRVSQTISNLDKLDNIIEDYIIHTLQKAIYDDDDEYVSLYDLINTETDDLDELVDEIFQLMFNSEEFDNSHYEYYNEKDIELYTFDMVLMSEYCNTYYSEEYGQTETTYFDDEYKLFSHYFYSYVSYNGLNSIIKEWIFNYQTSSAPAA